MYTYQEIIKGDYRPNPPLEVSGQFLEHLQWRVFSKLTCWLSIFLIGNDQTLGLFSFTEADSTGREIYLIPYLWVGGGFSLVVNLKFFGNWDFELSTAYKPETPDRFLIYANDENGRPSRIVATCDDFATAIQMIAPELEPAP